MAGHKLSVVDAEGAKMKSVERKLSKSREITPAQRQRLVMRYRLKARKLARSILRRWHCRLDLQEVDSVVDLSLCEAVNRFDPTKGASFMTFLFYHLRGNLIRTVTAAATQTAVPFAETDLAALAGHDSVENGGQANATAVADGMLFQERLLPDEMFLMKELISLSKEACAKLDALEREVVERIYVREEPLLDIAAALGYSRCHISRVKRKALESLALELNRMLGIDEENESAESADRRTARRRATRGEKAAIRAQFLMQAQEAA